MLNNTRVGSLGKVFGNDIGEPDSFPVEFFRVKFTFGNDFLRPKIKSG